MNERMGRRSSNTDSSSSSSSSSSSIDSSRLPYNHQQQHRRKNNNNNNNNNNNRSDLSTELRLGLSLITSSTSQISHPHPYDEPAASEYWTPNKSLLLPRSRLAENNTNNGNNMINYNNTNWAPPQQIRINRQAAESSSSAADATHFFVKVYMEGIPIGRKLDLFAHHGYHQLVTTLTRMFRTNILYPGIDRVHYDQDHVLTYEDKEGDLMMVGDVPWDLFLSTVKKLKITRSDNC